MEQHIRRQDYLTLHYIVKQAHKKYLKESRISKSPNFNILRVLSAFKQIFPTTPDKLYRLIMIITKNHNPQTLDQWNKAIDNINIAEYKKSQSSINFNESVLRHSHNVPQRLKRNSNSIKTYKQELDNQIDYIESKRSRLKFVGDFKTVIEPSWMENNPTEENKENIMEFSNRNSLRNSHHTHYISFQPNLNRDFTKQNQQKVKIILKSNSFNQEEKYAMQKKINPYHEITRIDNLSRIQDRQHSIKDESKTLYSHNYTTQENSRINIASKSSRDYSLTRPIFQDSKDGEASVKRSQIIHNRTAIEPLQCQDFNMTLAEWQNLNERTKSFYEFNIKLKAFSALLANYQAFAADKFQKNKAIIFHSTYLQSKALIAIKNNISIQQEVKRKNQKADDFHKHHLTRKVWKVLEVLKDLGIKKSERDFDISKLNKINYEFLLSFMFEQKVIEQSPSKKEPLKKQKVDQSFDFERKAEYFSKTKNFENVWNIYKCFGLNINISKEQLAGFFKNYHNCIRKSVFDIFKRNAQHRKQNYLRLHNSRLIEKSFSILKGRWQIAKDINKKLFQAESHFNKKLKQKAYKILLSIVYSTKIFSKRQEFIENKRIAKTKMKLFKRWASEYKKIQNEKKLKMHKLQILFQNLNQFVLNKALASIKQESQRILQSMSKIERKYFNNLKQRVFRHLSGLLFHKKKYMSLCQSNQVQFQKKILRKWLRLAQTQKGLNAIAKSFKKIIFREMFVPLQKQLIRRYLINQQTQKTLLKECFQQLRLNTLENQNRRKEAIIEVQKFLADNCSKDLIRCLKINCLSNQNQRKKQEVLGKTVELQKYLRDSTSSIFFVQFKTFYQKEQSLKQKMHQTYNLIKQSSISIIFARTEQSICIRENKKSFESYLKHLNLKSMCFELKRNQSQKREETLRYKTSKKILSSFLGNLSQKLRQIKQKQQKSHLHHNKSLHRRVLMAFVTDFIDVTEKYHFLLKTLKQQQKKQYFGVFKQKVKKEVLTKKKELKLTKLQVFSSLRLNLSFRNRENTLMSELRARKIRQTLQNLMSHVQENQNLKRIDNLQNKLKKKLFWMRFNEYFIQGLFQKKHIFMAYKFRALKLYGLAFRTWKRLVLNRGESTTIKEKKRRQSEKQKYSNHRQKQSLQMNRPTDCS